MSNNDLLLSARLLADTSSYVRGLGVAGRETKSFVAGAKSEMKALTDGFNGIKGKLAGIGVTLGATALIMRSARIDKELTLIGQTAGAGKDEVHKLRGELWSMSKETGKNFEDLEQGFDGLVAQGFNFKESFAVIDPINKAMAVSKATADQLSGALGVARVAFNFDLTKPGEALKILDQMVVAAGNGNAELSNLSGIISRIGPGAANAGFDLPKTLAFVEALSLSEKSPDRLGTLADSALRLFTNAQYQKSATAATGVKFFDAAGARRDPLAIYGDLKAQYEKLKTDQARSKYISKAFGQTDLDTQKSLQILLSGNSLDKFRQFTNDAATASGEIGKRMKDALDNSIDQVGRLKASLGQAADRFVQPINHVIDRQIQFLMNKKEKGGLELSGGEMLAGGAGALAAGYLAKRFKLFSLGGLGGSANSLLGFGKDVAAGKALEAAAGVVPVYVVNMSTGTNSWVPTIGAGGAGAAAAATARAAGGVGAGWWGALGLLATGGLTYSAIKLFEASETVSKINVKGGSREAEAARAERVSQAFGTDNWARRAAKDRYDQAVSQGFLKIEIDSNAPTRIVEQRMKNGGLEVQQNNTRMLSDGS